MQKVSIRPASMEDAAGIAEIFRYYVEHTVVTSEFDAPDEAQMKERIRIFGEPLPFLVCTVGERLVGYAYARPHREKAGYAWTVETSIYVHQDVQREGIGATLYDTLFALLLRQGYFSVFVGIAEDNSKSLSFHKKIGFDLIGIEKPGMYKFSKWHNTVWMHRALRAYDTPGAIVSFQALAETRDAKDALKRGEEAILHRMKGREAP